MKFSVHLHCALFEFEFFWYFTSQIKTLMHKNLKRILAQNIYDVLAKITFVMVEKVFLFSHIQGCAKNTFRMIYNEWIFVNFEISMKIKFQFEAKNLILQEKNFFSRTKCWKKNLISILCQKVNNTKKKWKLFSHFIQLRLPACFNLLVT